MKKLISKYIDKEHDFEYLELPKEVLESNIQNREKIVYALLFTNSVNNISNYTQKDIWLVLQLDCSIVNRSFKRLKEAGFIRYTKKSIEVLKDTDIYIIPFNLIYSLSYRELFFFYKIKNEGVDIETVKDLTNKFGISNSIAKKYFNHYKELNLL